MSYQVTVHDDQPERKAYGEQLTKQLWALYLEHGKGFDAYLVQHRDEILAGAIEKWGLPYAQRLYNMALERTVIREILGD